MKTKNMNILIFILFLILTFGDWKPFFFLFFECLIFNFSFRRNYAIKKTLTPTHLPPHYLPPSPSIAISEASLPLSLRSLGATPLHVPYHYPVVLPLDLHLSSLQWQDNLDFIIFFLPSWQVSSSPFFFPFILGCISNNCHCCVNLQRVGNKAPCLGYCLVSQREGQHANDNM